MNVIILIGKSKIIMAYSCNSHIEEINLLSDKNVSSHTQQVNPMIIMER